MLPSQYAEVAGRPQLKALLARQVDMQFIDVRTMLRLPTNELAGGCNFATASTIFNIIGGASVCFYNAAIEEFESAQQRGARFKGLLREFYPWQGETVGKERAITMLYSFARNPLAHAFGLDAARVDDPLLEIGKGPLSAEQIAQLEDSRERPAFTLASVYAYEKRRPGDERYVIAVPTLYWGLHRMLHALFADDRQVDRAEALAAELARRESAREEAKREDH